MPFRIPAPGDSLNFEDLSIRDFFFFYSIVKQENKNAQIGVKTNLLIDDSISNDYIINGFSLYKGSIDSLPDQYRDDWFFWTRLEAYLKSYLEDRSVSLSFSLYINGTETNQYKVRKTYVFLLADNWGKGLDSRYFGPVKSSNIVGRAFFVLWSYGKTNDKSPLFKFKRFGRIIS